MISLKNPLSLLSFFLLLLSFPLVATPASPFEIEFLNQLNRVRSQEKLPSLLLDPTVQALSQEWSSHLAQEQKTVHRSSCSLIEFIKKHSYSFASENLHHSPQGNDPSFVLHRWMNSPIHRKNLLHPKLTHMGITTTQGKEGIWYVVWNGVVKN